MGSRLEQKSNLIRKRIEGHTFDDEKGEEYEPSRFGGYNDYFRRKKIKLQNLDHELRASSSGKPQIFKGVVCHVNGYTQPSLNDLHVLVVEHGGGFIQYLDGKTMVTHIIASNLTPKKKEEFRRYRIVKPAWIVDSVKAGKLLPWDAYRVVDEGVAQKVLGFDNGKVVSQVNQKAKGYREQTDTSWYTSEFAGGQRVEKQAQSQHSTTDSVDDGFTSSIERALGEVATDGVADDSVSHGQQAVEPESAIAVHEAANQAVDIEHAPEEIPILEEPSFEADGPESAFTSKLKERQGSQEPDYSMAVVANSEVLKAIPPEKLAQMTAEEHNALLLSDPKIRKSTVVHPDFLEQYYRESRLHHLSTWKADLKSQMQALAAEKSSQKPKMKKLPGQRRYIMHVDFDSFFAAVSLKKYPQYKEKPTVVAHGGGSGSEIASCNYKAREFGIKNGMWMRRAQELCSDLKILPYDFPEYEIASRKFYDAILATGGIVQSVSIDEALVDISTLCFTEAGTDGVKRNEGAADREQQKADDIGNGLRAEVLRETGCAVSVGIGGNILQAKVALRKAKPAGQFQLKPEDVLDFMGMLEVQALPGIAWSIGGKLEDIGIKLVKDVRECTKERLISTLGPKTGEKIWEYARGIDKVEVGDQVVRKSVSAEVNWGVRFENNEQVDEFMAGLCGELHKRLVKEQVKGKQLTMKVMRRAADAPLDPPKHLGHGKCDTYNKSMQLGVSTNDAALITKEATAMIRSFNVSPGELRGIGVQMQKLEPLKPIEQSSQKRLQFKTGSAEKVVKDVVDAVQEASPAKASIPKENAPSVPIKLIGQAGRRSLNTLGTQFLMPTQVDPKVLAELPDDIRERLTRNAGSSKLTQKLGSQTLPPTESQLDPEALEALPAELREEVLAAYNTPRKKRQVVLPQSPHKNKIAPPNLKKKKPGIVSTFRKGGDSTLTQTNFVAKLNDVDTDRSTDVEAEAEPVDEAFLAELPEDIRQEVLEQQRQARLQRTGGIDTSLHQKPKKRAVATGPLDRVINVSRSVTIPTFTSRKLSALPELREAINSWIEEFGDDGPFGEDTTALIVYLKAVILQEKNLAKAVAVVRWLIWVVEEKGQGDVWNNAVKKIENGVQEAARERGIAAVRF